MTRFLAITTADCDLPLQLLEGEFEVFFKDDTKVAIAFITNVTSAILVLKSTENTQGE